MYNYFFHQIGKLTKKKKQKEDVDERLIPFFPTLMFCFLLFSLVVKILEVLSLMSLLSNKINNNGINCYKFNSSFCISKY